MKIHELSSELWVPHPLDEVFEFFADAGNLDELTPPWLRFEIMTPLPLEMRAGALIDYRIRVRGIPLKWRTEISAWDPPHRFVDEQVKGPYRSWHHEHTFASIDGGTAIRDVVHYSVAGWFLEPLIHGIWVRPDVTRIFEYRRDRLASRYGHGPTPEAAPR